MRYHVRRRGFYERTHAGVLFLALVFGSATIAAFSAEFGKDWPLWLKLLPAALASVLSAADLIFGSSRKAWLHADLARPFIDLERELARTRGEVTDASAVPKVWVNSRGEDVIFFDGVFFEPSLKPIFFVS